MSTGSQHLWPTRPVYQQCRCRRRNCYQCL